MTLLAGCAAAILVWWVIKLFAGTNPAAIAKLVRGVGGGAALVGAGLFLIRGRIDMAALLGSGGAWLLGWNALPFPFGRRPSAASRAAGSASRVRSASVEMELDHDTGRVSGSVLAGVFAGRTLDDLAEPELHRLRRDCLAHDPEGVRLVETYLDRRFPAWREDADSDPDGRGQPDPELGTMTQQEAYQVLGLEPGADADAVRRAHRELMKRLHPDGGGSTYLASRVNQAKDVLLDRHR